MSLAERLVTSSYRASAAFAAELVSLSPILERVAVAGGRRIWSVPGVGRAYRSVAERTADRLRERDSRFRKVSICGAVVTVDVTEFTTRGLYFGGSLYEPATTRYIREHLRVGDVFFDVGANHGYFTLLAAATVGPVGQVFAFEPNPPVFDQLTRHVAINSFESFVVPLQVALGQRDTSGKLYVSQTSSNSGLSSLSPSPKSLNDGCLSRNGTTDVVINTFDGQLAASGLDHVDLVKIDVEGAERDVVQGMAVSLARGAVGSVICETTWDSDAHQLLRRAGFQARILESAWSVANILYTSTGAARPFSRRSSRVAVGTHFQKR